MLCHLKLDHSPTPDNRQEAQRQIKRAELASFSAREAEQNPARVLSGHRPDTTNDRRDQAPGSALEVGNITTGAAAREVVANIVLTLNTVATRKAKVDAMMAQLLREMRDVRVRNHQRVAWKVSLAILFLLLLCYLRGNALNLWWLFVWGGGAAAADERAGRRRQAAHALYLAGEPRAVGVLAVASRDGDHAVQRVADQALRDLLPRVRASDSMYIDAEQMHALLELAEHGNAHMQSNVLKALEQIGDQRAIPVVENLTLAGRTTNVRRCALACLPFLIERVRLAREQSTLLRASASPGAAAVPAQLLRPANGVEDTPPQQLLRASRSL